MRGTEVGSAGVCRGIECPIAWVEAAFSGTVAVLPPIADPHVIASQSDALPNLQVLSEKWLVNTL
jgi:hypothetical protein